MHPLLFIFKAGFLGLAATTSYPNHQIHTLIDLPTEFLSPQTARMTLPEHEAAHHSLAQNPIQWLQNRI